MTERSVTTLQSRCRLAASYVQRYNLNPSSFWIAIGKLTSWPDDNNPPYPGLTLTRLPELHAFCYVHTCVSVYANSNGSIITPKGNYSPITSTDYDALASAKANKVYFEAFITPDVMATNAAYRYKGLCTDVLYTFSAAPNPTSGTHISESAVQSYFLDRSSFHSPVINDGTTTQVIQIVREF